MRLPRPDSHCLALHDGAGRANRRPATQKQEVSMASCGSRRDGGNGHCGYHVRYCLRHERKDVRAPLACSLGMNDVGRQGAGVSSV